MAHCWEKLTLPFSSDLGCLDSLSKDATPWDISTSNLSYLWYWHCWGLHFVVICIKDCFIAYFLIFWLLQFFCLLFCNVFWDIAMGMPVQTDTIELGILWCISLCIVFCFRFLCWLPFAVKKRFFNEGLSLHSSLSTWKHLECD